MIFVRPPLTTEPLYLGSSSIKIMEEGYISSSSHNTSSSAAVATATSETSSSSKTARLLLPAGFEPTPNSVIIGRNKQSKNAPGTRSLIALAKKAYLPRYSQAESKREKTGIVTEIVKVIRAACPVGAFITLDRGRWLEVGDLTAREKYVVVVVVVVRTHTPLAGFEYFVLNKLPVSTIFPRSANNNRVGFVFRSLLQDRYRSSSKSKLLALKRRLDSKEDESSNTLRLLLLQGSTAADRAGGMSITPKSQPQLQDASMTSLTAARENHGRGTTEQPPKRLVSSPVVVRRDEESNHQDVCAPPKMTTSSTTISSSILDHQHQTTSCMPPHQEVASSGGRTISQAELFRLHQLYISSFDSLSPLPLNNHRRYRQLQKEKEQEYEDKKGAATIYGGKGVSYFRHDRDFCGGFAHMQDTYVSSSSTSSGVSSSSFFGEKDTSSRPTSTRESTPRGMMQRQRGDDNCDKITTEEKEAATGAAATSTTSRHGAPPSAPTSSPGSNQNREQWRHCNVRQQVERGSRLFLARDQHLPAKDGMPIIPHNNSFMLDACDLSDEDTVTVAIFD
jgi:hypothetical protein